MSAENEPEQEPEPAFYRRGGPSFFGNLYWHLGAAAVYIILALLPVIAISCGHNLRSLAFHPFTIWWAVATSVAYPLWSWGEFRAFESWVRAKPPADRRRERAYFASVTTITRTFWTAVLATYTIAGVWSIALSASSQPQTLQAPIPSSIARPVASPNP